MADHLAFIYGTEQDRVNCPFYFKIGACRHGEQCTRKHNKPTESQTILFMNLYQNPYTSYGPKGEALFDQAESDKHFEHFFWDIFNELVQFGEIEELNCCSNLGEHLFGNVYCKYHSEDSARKALENLMGRFYAGRPVVAELSPVTDFREARCRQFDQSTCARGGYCNFMHLRPVDKKLNRLLIDMQRKLWRNRRNGHTKRKSERSGDRSRSRDRKRRRSRSHSRERKKRRERSASPPNLDDIKVKEEPKVEVKEEVAPPAPPAEITIKQELKAEVKTEDMDVEPKVSDAEVAKKVGDGADMLD